MKLKVVRDVKGAVKGAGGIVKGVGQKPTKDKKKNQIEPTISNSSSQPVFNQVHQQAQDEMQQTYTALGQIQQQKVSHLLGMVNEFSAMCGPAKKELTDDEMTQMTQDYFNSEANKAVLNFCKELNQLIKQHENTADESVITAAKQLSAALLKQGEARCRGYLVNQRELSDVGNSLLSDSRDLINRYSEAIEEDPSFYASFLRLINYLFGNCMAQEIPTTTIFSESKVYQNLKFSIFNPEAKERQIENEEQPSLIVNQ